MKESPDAHSQPGPHRGRRIGGRGGWMPATASLRVAMPPCTHLFLQTCLPSGRGLCPAYCRLPVGSSKTPQSATEIQQRFDSLVICVTQNFKRTRSGMASLVGTMLCMVLVLFGLLSFPPGLYVLTDSADDSKHLFSLAAACSVVVSRHWFASYLILQDPAQPWRLRPGLCDTAAIKAVE